MSEAHEIRQSMNELDYYRELQRLSDENYQLMKLLREWRETPFFDDKDSWLQWVTDFGNRVDKAIR